MITALRPEIRDVALGQETNGCHEPRVLECRPRAETLLWIEAEQRSAKVLEILRGYNCKRDLA
jgi:hypothetical protein